MLMLHCSFPGLILYPKIPIVLLGEACKQR